MPSSRAGRVGRDAKILRMVSPAPRRHHPFGEYLDVEEKSREVKHEYVRGEIFAMAGGSPEHAALAQAIGALLFPQIRGGPCRAYSAGLRIRIREADVATYADASLVCGPLARDPESPSHVTNPSVVFEVLSPSTEAYDRVEKREAYLQLDALQAYVLVSQDRRRVELWHRQGSSFVYLDHGAGETVELPALGARLDVDELYEAAGVEVT